MRLPNWQNFFLRYKMTTTDAAPRQTNAIIPTSLMDPVVLRGVEKHLDPYERVSCLFLMIEEYREGYDAVIDLGRGDDVVSKFLETRQVRDWEHKILEILSLLQNNEILYNLGVCPDAVQTRYSRKVLEVTVRVNKIAKAFYQMFESLTKNEAQTLLARVYREVQEPDDEYWLVNDSLEMHLLWWIKNDFVKIHRGDKWSLKKLLEILKEIDMSDNKYYEALKKYDEDSSDPCYNDGSTVNQDAAPVVRGDPIALRNDSSDEFYRVQKGFVVVFNQMKFPNYPYREGSKMDCRRIKETFENKFGFHYEEFEDAKRAEIYEELDNLGERAKDYDCVVVFFLSHGVLHHVIASDGLECPIVTIRSKLCAPALNAKPKVLVIQACQPEKDNNESTRTGLDTDGPNNVMHGADRQRHIFIFNSTIPGEVAVRHELTGTWFIQALCDVLNEMHQNQESVDFETCAKRVIKHFEKKEGITKEYELVKQAPEYTNNITKRLIFPIKND